MLTSAGSGRIDGVVGGYLDSASGQEPIDESLESCPSRLSAILMPEKIIRVDPGPDSMFVILERASWTNSGRQMVYFEEHGEQILPHEWAEVEDLA